MPIYEYQCTECGELHEALQKLSDALLTDCPACGKSALRKKVSAAAFRLKGSGWYETDFKSGQKKNLAGEAGKEPSNSDSAARSTGDAKGADSSGSSGKESKPAAEKKSTGGGATGTSGGSTSTGGAT